jgi:hypothetical protein
VGDWAKVDFILKEKTVTDYYFQEDIAYGCLLLFVAIHIVEVKTFRVCG